jgi:homoserine O-acetyltransferase/O-succinyltransferase
VKPLGWLALLVGVVATSAYAAAPESETLEPTQHEFVVKSFKTESGTVLPEAHVVYGTYGELNAAGDNAILLPSHYMAEMHGYGWLIGQGKSLDDFRYGKNVWP